MVQGVGKNGELFEQLIDPEFLFACARRAARRKRSKRDVAEFLLNLEPRVFGIAEELRDGSWQPGDYHAFWIHDPKRRLISAAPFADRVVHHGLVSLMEPHFERRFVDHSYACRKGKGTHKALRRAHRLARRHAFVLRGDIAKFFPSLDHDVVKQAVRRVIADRPFLEILDRVIDGSNPQERVQDWFPGDDLFTPGERCLGMPIGNLTSQFLANVVLDRLDHLVQDDLGYGGYIRYCDDFLVFGNDKVELQKLRTAVGRCLSGLRLRLHPRKGGVASTKTPLPFLGFVIREGRLRLKRGSVVRATRRMKRARTQVASGRLQPERFHAGVRGWIAHAAHGDTWAIRRHVLRQVFAKGRPSR